jgi:alpha-tubulin suppressor-like RCC1 family protein
MTCLVVLGTPNGYAEIMPDLGSGLPLMDEQPNPGSWSLPTTTDTVGQPFSFIKNAHLSVPQPPNDDGPYLDVDAGNTAVCAIRQDRTLRCWGMNDLGQASPPKGRFKTVSMGDVHGCGIRINGRLSCWGGTLGRPTNEKNLGTFLKVLAADGHTCALRTDHKFKCWGSDLSEALTAPNGKFKTGDARSERSCGIRMNGEMECWGGQTLRQFQQPSGHFDQVVLGMTHACAIRAEDRSAVCWGNNLYGEANPPSGTFLSLAAGDFHTCGLREDGSSICWGRNQFGQTDLPPEKYRNISTGGAISCGTLEAGQLRCVGSYANNDFLTQLQRESSAEPINDVQAKLFPFAFLTQLGPVNTYGAHLRSGRNG